MTSEKASWSLQTAFDGGIQQQPETAAKNSVLDASNVWTPFTRADRRPGYSAIPSTFEPVGSAWNPDATLYDVSGNVIASGHGSIFFSGPVPAGSYLVLTGPAVVDTKPVGGLRFSIEGSPDPPIPAENLQLWGALTDRGVVMLDAPLESYVTIGIDLWQITRPFVLPKDTTIDSSGNITITVFFCEEITDSVRLSDFLVVSPSTAVPLGGAGTWRIEYNGGIRFLAAYSGTFNQSPQLTFDPAHQKVVYVDSSIPVYPPQIAVIPELDILYHVSGGHTTRVAKKALLDGTTDAQIAYTQDGTIVDAPPDVMAVYDTFPGGDQIINFRGHLFASGSRLRQAQNILYWNFGNLSETSSGAIIDTSNIWPTTAFAALSDARDNSEITALFPVGDNLGVSKKNSIWLAPLAASKTPGAISGGVVVQNAVLVDQFSVQLVVPGVGFLAPGSVQAIPGGILGLSEDGFYLFDGTPSIKGMSYDIQGYVNRINPSRKPYAQGINWRTQRMYLCAVSLDESTTNNAVLVFDYQSKAWWVFQGQNDSLDIVNWLVIDGVGFREEVWFQDSQGNLNKLIGDTDYGLAIESFILTQRFGEFDIQGRDILEIRSQSTNQQNNYVQPSAQLLVDDIPVVTQGLSGDGTQPVNFPLSGETKWSEPPVSGVSAYAPERRRERKTPITGSGYWFQVKLSGFLQYIMAAAGFTPNGRR